MADHTKDTLSRFLLETNYGGGTGATDYLKTAPSTWGDLDVVSPFPMGEQTMPYCEYEREEVRAAGDDVHDVHLFNKSRIKKDSTNKYYLQNKTFLVAAISATAGNPGTSYCVHYEKPEGEFDGFGLVVQEYSFEFGGAGEFPSESIKWNYYDVATSSAITPYSAITDGAAGETTVSTGTFTDSAKGNFDTTIGVGDILQITSGSDEGKYVVKSITNATTLEVYGTFSASTTGLSWKTIPKIYYTIHPLTMDDISLKIGVNGADPTSSVDVKSCNFTITNEFEEFNPAGSWIGKKPGLINRTVNLSLTFTTYSDFSELIDDTRTETVSANHSFELTIGTWKITFTNMRVSEGNVEKIPEFGFYEYNLTLLIGTDFSVAVADV